MTNLTRAKNLYYEKGIKVLLRKSFGYTLAASPIAPYLKSLVGETLHQKLLMYAKLGYWPNIREPRTFNEKIMYRKLHTDNDLFARVEDKWRVRDYVRDRVGEDVLPDVYHLTDDPSTIPFNSLPAKFVIKPTHLSGPVIFVDEGEEIEQDVIKKRCHEWLSQKEYKSGIVKGEYWFNDIKPRILIEERLKDDEHDIPLDYKLFVFHGQVEYIEVDYDRFEDHSRRFYDREWNPQDFELKYPLGPKISEPEQLDKMTEVAETLGQEFDFMRIDLYQPNGEKVVFGEMTVAHGSGGERFKPREYDYELGSLW